ncbi:NADH-quinone oxidoreductase subunit J [Thermanaerothrix sp.]|jgi:NADH:ubiquinone oxidoreductase subunit 6 (subunit J)|uniref:NADH-quinone oxidoreductase subunit J n=1 Tax=Thermanaerothrix sp. TaxID=2972675 RepID=UPI002ADDC443|nr:NADH-quinone oxidoreductase subunit J [Thermanaerothrix sp.]
MLYALVGVGALGCAVAAVTSKRMLISAIWLALASALVALDMYLLGAPFIAVIELSVGAGLVTVLFVFAINLTGDEALPVANSVFKWLALTLILACSGITAYLVFPRSLLSPSNPETLPLLTIFWDLRRLDTWLQAFLIFAGALTVLGLFRSASHESAKKEE